MRISAVLAQHVAHPPDSAEGSVRHRLRANARVERPPFWSERFHRSRQKLALSPDSLRFVPEQPGQLADRAVIARRAHGGRVSTCPPQRHARDHDRRIEHGERCGHHVAGNLAHHRTSAGEVRRPVGQRHVVGRSGARLETECGVVGVAFGREVHLADNRLEDGTEPSGGNAERGVGHRLKLRLLAQWTRCRRVPQVTATIEIVDEPTSELVEAFARLLPQLSSAPPPSAADLAAIMAEGSMIFVARVDGRIVGSLTLVMYRIATGLKAWIEDVVVDETARGHGVGEALNMAALDEARKRGAKAVSLTSRPSREAANRLYQRIGFSARDTNVYRYDLWRCDQTPFVSSRPSGGRESSNGSRGTGSGSGEEQLKLDRAVVLYGYHHS